MVIRIQGTPNAESVLGGASSAGLAKQHTMSSYLRE
jgi:hypothetical protein